MLLMNIDDYPNIAYEDVIKTILDTNWDGNDSEMIEVTDLGEDLIGLLGWRGSLENIQMQFFCILNFVITTLTHVLLNIMMTIAYKKTGNWEEVL